MFNMKAKKSEKFFHDLDFNELYKLNEQCSVLKQKKLQITYDY